MADAPSLLTGQTKAGDWRSYERVILPPVKDLHKLDVYEANGGYGALRAVVADGKFDRAGLTNEVLLTALTELPTEQRECLIMRFLQGMSIAETALALDRTAGAIKQLQLRGVRNLAKLLPEGMRDT